MGIYIKDEAYVKRSLGKKCNPDRADHLWVWGERQTTVDGKKVRTKIKDSFGPPTPENRRKAEARLASYLHAQDAMTANPAGADTFQWWADKTIASIKATKKSKTYSDDMVSRLSMPHEDAAKNARFPKFIHEVMGHIPIDMITPATVDELIDRLRAEGRVDKTVKNYLDAVAFVLRRAVRKGAISLPLATDQARRFLVEDSNTKAGRAEQEEASTRKPFSLSEVALLLEASSMLVESAAQVSEKKIKLSLTIPAKARGRLQAQAAKAGFSMQHHCSNLIDRAMSRFKVREIEPECSESVTSKDSSHVRFFEGPSAKISVEFFADQISAVESAARAAGLNRSRFASELLIQELDAMSDKRCVSASIAQDAELAGRRQDRKVAGSTTPESALRGHVATLLMLDAGLRHGEVNSRQWSDISGGKILVQKTKPRDGQVENAPKSGRKRSVVLSRRLAAAMQDFWMRLGQPPQNSMIFGDMSQDGYRTGHFARACALAKKLHREREMSGLEGLEGWDEREPKDLRDTYASLLLTAGIPLGYISGQLGHGNVAVTATHYAEYVSVDDEYVPPPVLEEDMKPADLLERLVPTIKPLAALG